MGVIARAASWFGGNGPEYVTARVAGPAHAAAGRVVMHDDPPRREPPPGVAEWIAAHRPPTPPANPGDPVDDGPTVAPGPAWAPSRGAPFPVAHPVRVEPRVGALTRFLRWTGLADDAPAPAPAPDPGGPRMLPPAPMVAPAPVPPQLAPWPQVDKYPTVIGGSNLSFERLSAILRVATLGYRREFVDAVNELLERDPHASAVCRQRILAVAGARVEVVAAQLPDGDPRHERAEELRAAVEKMLTAIPRLRQALAALSWAIVYGVAAQEVVWGEDPDGTVRPVELRFVHSRRLAYPDPMSWDVRIWDQGSVNAWYPRAGEPTAGVFGLRVADYPGKFVVHAPQLRGDYPTRDGLGRDLVWWMVVKGLGARGLTEYVERFGKPWVLGTFSTKNADAPAGRAANKDDIAKGFATVGGMGVGGLAGSMLPDSIKIELVGPGVSASGAAIDHEDLIKIADQQMSKAVLGQSDTTDAGANGSRSSTETRKDSTRELYRYDATNLGETLDHDLVRPFVVVNYPDDADLAPSVRIVVDEKPSAADMLALVEKLVAMGAPVDADEVAADAAVPLVEKVGDAPRRLTRAGAAPADAPALPPGHPDHDPDADPADSDAKPGAAPPVETGDVVLAPTDNAAVVRVDEARAAMGLPPLGGPDGALTIPEYKAKHASVIADAAAAEGGKSKPTDPDKAAAPFGARPGAPPFPPRGGAPPAPPGRAKGAAAPEDDEDAEGDGPAPPKPPRPAK